MHKKISKKKFIAHVGIVQCMNALADKVRKQDVPCIQLYAIHDMHGHYII